MEKGIEIGVIGLGWWGQVLKEIKLFLNILLFLTRLSLL